MTDQGPSRPVCPACQAPLPVLLCNAGAMGACPACATRMQVVLFPAFFRAIEKGLAAETVGAAGEASCFFHADRKAVVACESCGRFLCALCHVQIGKRDLCPNCIQSDQRKGRLDSLDRRRVLHDAVAMALAVYPMVIPVYGWICSPVTAPICLYIVVRRWTSPLSVVSRGRWRLAVAGLLAALQLAAWAVLAVVLLAKWLLA